MCPFEFILLLISFILRNLQTFVEITHGVLKFSNNFDKVTKQRKVKSFSIKNLYILRHIQHRLRKLQKEISTLHGVLKFS